MLGRGEPEQRARQNLDPAADTQQVITTLQSIEPVWDERFPADLMAPFPVEWEGQTVALVTRDEG